MFIRQSSETSAGNNDHGRSGGTRVLVRRIHKQSRLRHVEASSQTVVAFHERLGWFSTDDWFRHAIRPENDLSRISGGGDRRRYQNTHFGNKGTHRKDPVRSDILLSGRSDGGNSIDMAQGNIVRRPFDQHRREGFDGVSTSEYPLIRPVGHLLPLPGGEGTSREYSRTPEASLSSLRLIQKLSRLTVSFQQAGGRFEKPSATTGNLF